MSCRFCLTDGLRNLTRRGTVTTLSLVARALSQAIGPVFEPLLTTPSFTSAQARTPFQV